MVRSKVRHFEKFSIVDGDVQVKLNLLRFEKQFQEAQYQLDGDVMNSMIPFMPFIKGNFVQNTKKESGLVQGSGQVYAAFGVQGRYLYEGKVMVDSQTGKGPRKIPDGPGGTYVLRFRKGAKLKATDRPLQYTRTDNREVTDHWFDAAKEKCGKQWIKQAKHMAGGGKRD